MKDSFEIERKLLIKMPDTSLLLQRAERVLKITQIYIGKNEEGFNCRIRKVETKEKISYIYTEKKNVNSIKRIENEFEISQEDYEKLKLKQINNTIEKIRYCIAENVFVYEIDIYPFWQNQAIMEIELESEEIIPPLPDFIDIIKDVTFEKGYSNYAFSKEIPIE